MAYPVTNGPPHLQGLETQNLQLYALNNQINEVAQKLNYQQQLFSGYIQQQNQSIQTNHSQLLCANEKIERLTHHCMQLENENQTLHERVNQLSSRLDQSDQQMKHLQATVQYQNSHLNKIQQEAFSLRQNPQVDELTSLQIAKLQSAAQSQATQLHHMQQQIFSVQQNLQENSITDRLELMGQQIMQLHSTVQSQATQRQHSQQQVILPQQNPQEDSLSKRLDELTRQVSRLHSTVQIQSPTARLGQVPTFPPNYGNSFNSNSYQMPNLMHSSYNPNEPPRHQAKRPREIEPATNATDYTNLVSKLKEYSKKTDKSIILTHLPFPNLIQLSKNESSTTCYSFEILLRRENPDTKRPKISVQIAGVSDPLLCSAEKIAGKEDFIKIIVQQQLILAHQKVEYQIFDSSQHSSYLNKYNIEISIGNEKETLPCCIVSKRYFEQGSAQKKYIDDPEGMIRLYTLCAQFNYTKDEIITSHFASQRIHQAMKMS